MRRFVVALLVIGGCHKLPSSGSTTDADALWALAPAGTKAGIVITPRAARMIEHAWHDVHAFIKTAPELAPLTATLDSAVASLGAGPELDLGALGISTDRGAAVFYMGGDQGLLVVPVVDRDKFLAKVHGTKGSDVDRIEEDFVCKPIKNVYACGDNEKVIDTLGTGKLAPHLAARGDIEMFADDVPELVVQHADLALQLQRGEVVARGSVKGMPPRIAALFGPPVPVSIDREHTAGFVAANVAGLVRLMPPVFDAPELAPGVLPTTLVQSVAGPVMMTIPAGPVAFDARIELTDPAPARAVIDHCPALVPGATSKDGTCTLAVPMMPTSVTAQVAGKSLHVVMKTGAPNASPLTPIGTELATGSWNISAWGRGSLFAAPAMFGMAFPADVPPVQMVLRAMTAFSELGIGAHVTGQDATFVAVIRTVWSNPDDVVAKLATIPMADVLAGKAADRAKQIAGSSTPLADDLKAGYAGYGLPAGLLGALAIPMAMDSAKKTKQTEASLQLNKLAKILKLTYVDKSAFPVGDTALTPPESCCKGPHIKCAGGAAEWKAAPWQALDFSIAEPHLYQYRYHSDGKTAEVDAVGDLDCDGIAITYRLKVDADDQGMAHARIEEPPPNTD
jgi:hypothetical protein